MTADHHVDILARPAAPDYPRGAEHALAAMIKGLTRLGWDVHLLRPGDAVSGGPRVYWRVWSPDFDDDPLWTAPGGPRVLWPHHHPVPDGLLQAADRVWLLSNYHDFLARRPGQGAIIELRGEVIGNGIAPAEFPPLWQPWQPSSETARRHEPLPFKRPPLVLYTAPPDRGLDELLSAWPAVVEAVPEAHLAITQGTDPMKAAGMGLAAEPWDRVLAEADRLPGVHVTGWLPRQELLELLHDARVWVHPGRHPHAELFCIAAVEAMAAGCCPVIADQSALMETVRFSFHYRAPPGRLAAAIIAALHDPGEPRTRRRWASDRFAWERVIARADRSLRALAGRG